MSDVGELRPFSSFTSAPSAGVGVQSQALQSVANATYYHFMHIV